jgi:hypothetical protein
MLKSIFNLLMVFSLFPCMLSMADEGLPSSDQIVNSTKQLEDQWDGQRKDFKKKFKQQVKLIEKKKKELSQTLDNGDMAKRKDLDKKIKDMQELLDKLHKNYHELTATSIVDLF